MCPDPVGRKAAGEHRSQRGAVFAEQILVCLVYMMLEGPSPIRIEPAT